MPNPMPNLTPNPTLHIRPYEAADEAAVIALWHACGLTRPWNDPRRDIARKLSVQPELFLIGSTGAGPVATAMVGFDGHRGWVNQLAVAPGHRHQSTGRALMQEAVRRLTALGCPKLNLQVRSSNAEVLAFYRALGDAPDEVVSLGRRLIADDQA